MQMKPMPLVNNAMALSCFSFDAPYLVFSSWPSSGVAGLLLEACVLCLGRSR